MRYPAVSAILLVLLTACREDETASAPPPAPLTAEAAGHYCGMDLMEMPGPKAQVALEGYPEPVFFSQVRDGIAYLRSPEQDARILAFYVSDMSRAKDWADPGADNWIAAGDAWFVVGSRVAGGMGAPEIVPFDAEADASRFAAANGGTVLRLDQIPTEAALAPVDIMPEG